MILLIVFTVTCITAIAALTATLILFRRQRRDEATIENAYQEHLRRLRRKQQIKKLIDGNAGAECLKPHHHSDPFAPGIRAKIKEAQEHVSSSP